MSENSIKNSYGVNESYGVNGSFGVNRSFGVLNSFGVSNAIFLADKKRNFSIFGKEILEERFNEVWNELENKLNGWYPKFNNAFELYVKAGSDWKKVKASNICSKLGNLDEPYEAWKDMPVDAIDYVKSLEEFDAVMFKRITGIDVLVDDKVIELSNGAKVSEQTVREALEFVAKNK